MIFYISHRYDLIFYLRLQEALRNFDLNLELEVLLHPQLADDIKIIDLISKNFSNYKILPVYLNYSRFFWISFFQSQALKKFLQFNYNQHHIFVSLDKSQFISLFLLSFFKRIILIQQVEPNQGYIFDWKAIIIRNIYHFICGCRYMIFLKLKSSNGNINGLVFPQNNRPNIIYQSNSANINPKFNLPALNDIRLGKKIVIFGSRFNNWNFLSGYSLEIFKKKLSNIYKEIGNYFKGYEIIYISHPLEKGTEYEDINFWLGGILNKVTSYISSEHYLFCNRDVSYCFSIGSTSSHSAYSMGFNSKVFYKRLNFNPEIEAVYDAIFDGLPLSFFDNDFSYKSDSKHLINSNINDFIKML
jgi:hypothetical protein